MWHQGFKSINEVEQQQQLKGTSARTRKDNDNDGNSSESEEEQEGITPNVAAAANGSQSHVMTSLLTHIRGDALAARSRDSATVATNRAATTGAETATKLSPNGQPKDSSA